MAPGLVSLSDAQVEALVTWAKKGGHLVVTGEAGRYDDWNAQRFENTFLPQLKGLPNVVVRACADSINGADLNWRYTVPPPKDGGRALMADLAKVGWRAPVRFEGLPPHIFAEYRRMANGSLAVHLVNYDPDHPATNARVVQGGKVTFEEPFGADASVRTLAEGATIPPFKFYALLTVTP